jgi:Tol biopolymer transport system component
MRILIPLLGLALSIPAMAKDVMLMNRIGPSQSELYIASADGSGEHKLLSTSGGFDYHANFSYDGKWIVFTSERNGFGEADVYRVHADGTGLERLTDSPAMDDQGALSPDDSQLAFVSTRDTYRASIWIVDLKTKKLRNLTGASEIQGDHMKPDGFYRPQWSPDGKWIAFSSDRNTDWKGHDDNTGWEHLQELAIYIIHPDGTGFRRITGPGVTSGSPKWSADSKQIIYSEMPVQGSWLARVDQLSKLPFAVSQIVSINLETGKRTELTSGPGIKLSPEFLPDGRVGYTTKAGETTAIAYTEGSGIFPKNMRSPSWSADGKQVAYEKVDNTPRPQNQPLYSWDPNYDYRYTDVFPSFSKDGTLLITNKDVDSSIAIMNADGSDKKVVFKSATNCTSNVDGPCGSMDGVAFAPAWSPDGQWIVFGFGGYLRLRNTAVAKLMMIKRDGTGLVELTSGTPNTGFPSFSPDGKEIVYRSWGPKEDGLRIMNLETKQVRVLTDQLDNLPDWSVNNRIVFTRKSADNNFDIYTINPDGSDLKRLTTYPASDAHAVWSWDGKHIMWDSGEYGFKDEAALYDNSFQPYGQLWVMDADGSNKKPITDSRWEDSMACYAPPNALKK